MKYWEAVLEEVINKDEPSYFFAFTNLDVAVKRSRPGPKPKAMQNQEKRKVRSYYLGENFGQVYFTQREADCMVYLLQGVTCAEIAEILQLSIRTVEFYVKNMRKKLRCRDRAELINKVRHSQFMEYVEHHCEPVMAEDR